MERLEQERGPGKNEREPSPQEAAMAAAFLGLTPEQLGKLKTRIEKVGGHVRIAIHPHYLSRLPEFHPVDETRTEKDIADFLEEGFSRTVMNVANNQESAPLLVFEEKQFVDGTREDLASRIPAKPETLSDRGFAFYPTEPDDGLLSGDDAWSAYALGDPDGAAAQPEKSFQTTENRRQAVFEATIRALHIRSALISGAYFVELTHSPVQQSLWGCAGKVTTLLRDAGVLVDISRYSWEHRDDLKRAGIVTKQTGGVRSDESS